MAVFSSLYDVTDFYYDVTDFYYNVTKFYYDVPDTTSTVNATVHACFDKRADVLILDCTLAQELVIYRYKFFYILQY